MYREYGKYCAPERKNVQKCHSLYFHSVIKSVSDSDGIKTALKILIHRT